MGRKYTVEYMASELRKHGYEWRFSSNSNCKYEILRGEFVKGFNTISEVLTWLKSA